MKKLLFILFTGLISNIVLGQSMVNLKAQINNRNGDIVYIKDNFGKTIKEIKINDKGFFTDKFEVKDGFFSLYDGVEYAQLFLKGGFDLSIKLDAKEFDETLNFSGVGSEENNFLAENTINNENFEKQNFEKDKDAFYLVFDAKKKSDFEKLASGTYDENFKIQTKKSMTQEFLGMQMSYKDAQLTKGITGKASKSFDYENHSGGKTKLEDLKGKYVYIDVWATWCGPCRAEIPSLKKVEEKYHGKNIVFVSISVDEMKDHEKWVKFVKEKQLGGIQLYADKSWMSDFTKAFGINSIPRFILIDPQGNVVDANAKRPSDAQLQAQLDDLLIIK
ncbi:TlpA family protein disulfide reductase [Flavobacterium sp.]|uniref:TlpA family protein disulfide reductase n=1 Tax=Flavobacterium sp. TaxID=239 RepID=UPI003753CA8D